MTHQGRAGVVLGGLCLTHRVAIRLYDQRRGAAKWPWPVVVLKVLQEMYSPDTA